MTHNPFQTKPNSPFWLRGIFHCDKCGTRMIGNVTATTKKYGGQKYYVCGCDMRKGKEFCTYVSWRKEKVEGIKVNKLRSTLLRLTFDNQIGEEIRKYHNEMNKHVVVAVSNLESEILYLNRRIAQLEMELQTGGGKSYYADMIQELKDELTTKQAEQVDLQKSYHELELSETFLQTVMHDIRVMINMLDNEMKNPQLMNEYIRKFVSNICVYRDTKTVHITVQLKDDDEVLYEKVVVAEWE